MSADPIHLLQLYPLAPAFEQALRERFAVHTWHDVPDRDGFLAGPGKVIRAVVTGGHLGIDPSLAAGLPALEIVAINGVGYDKVDLAEARRRGIRVTNTPDVLTEDVADLAIGLMIALCRRIPAADRYARSGDWASGGDFPLTRKASGQRFGILGLGRIGRAIVRRLEGFGGTIGYFSRRADPSLAYRHYDTPSALAAASDVLIVSVAASSETRNLVDAGVLAALGPKGVLVNVARGSVVDEPALIKALADGGIAGAALDVFAHEPAIPAELAAMENVVLTPHVASATTACREAMAALVLANLDAHFTGAALPSAVV